MKPVVLLLACLAAASARLSYPSPPVDDTVDDYYGTKVPDPYRPLEDIDSPQTRTWVKAEAALTRSYLDAIPQRAAIKRRLTAMLDYERWTVPFHMGERYFFFYNTGLQNQAVLYTMRGIDGAARVFIDPNTLSKDGSINLGEESPSWNAQLLAYTTRISGSDWQTWHVRSVATGKDLPDVLKWSRFSDCAWLPDDSGFYYERYPAPAMGLAYKGALYDHAVYLHRLGTPQSSDRRIVYRPAHRNWLYGVRVTSDRRYGIVSVSSNDSINNRIAYFDFLDRKRRLMPLLWKSDALWTFVDNAGPLFFFSTALNAPNKRIVAVDLRNPAVRTVVAEASDQLQDASAVGHRFILSYLHDAHSAVRIYDEKGRFIRDVVLPGIGSASGFAGSASDRTTFYSYSGYTTAPAVYRYDVFTGATAVYRKARIPFDAAHYTTQEVFYSSKDGTRVPLILAHRKDIRLDGSHPTLLYGYGGFAIPQEPYFSTARAVWMQMGGIYAVPNIRGGSEYGEAWHKGGMLSKKQNVFDDFIAAAEYLIAQKYTSTSKLAIEGDSNGGLLIGAVETQRPDLFGAAIPGVGLLDMLRFDKFTVGNVWISEYGCSRCGKEQFDWLYSYSPYHNLKSGVAYPPTLIVTSDHDDHVFPAHSFKFAAKMQADQAGSAPVLLRVQMKAGHGEATTLAQSIDLVADEYAFLVRNLGFTL